MAIGMTTIIAKPPPSNIDLHGLGSATLSNRSFLPLGPSFHPLHSVDHERGFNRCNLSFMRTDQRKKLHMIVACSGQPVPPPAAPSGPFSGFPGKGWLIGIALSFFLPFMKSKWGPLMLLKKEVDTTLERVEETVEVAEKVLGEIEHVAHDIEQSLPEGQLKDAVSGVEHVVEQADKTAHLIDDTLVRVEKMEETFEARVESEVNRRRANDEENAKKLGKA